MAKAQYKDNRLWRTCKWLLRQVALVLGVFYLLPPGTQIFDEEKSYAPNTIQQEFIRLAAQKYDYIGLGDTDHTRNEITLFAVGPKMVSAIAKGGDKNLFLEVRPQVQRQIDDLQQGRSQAYRHADSSSWICNDDIKRRLNRTFEMSVRENKEIRFIAADMRHAEGGGLKKQNLNMKVLFTYPAEFYKKIYGCVDTPAFIPGSIIGIFTGLQQDLTRYIKDDKLTANFIKTHEGGGTIFFGAGHFMVKDKADAKIRMTELLKNTGRSMAVFNIYAGANQKNTASKTYHADAFFYVTPSPDNPDGIYINNPDLMPLLKKAKENIKAKEKATLAPSV